MALGGVGNFRDMSEADPRYSRFSATPLQLQIPGLPSNPAVVSRNWGAAVDQDGDLVESYLVTRQGTDQNQRNRARTNALSGIRAVLSGDRDSVSYVDTNMVRGRIPKDYYIEPRGEWNDKDEWVGEPRVAIRNPRVNRSSARKNPDEDWNPKANRVTSRRLEAGRQRTTEPNDQSGDHIRIRQRSRPRYESSYDPILGSLQYKGFGISPAEGKLADEQLANYQDVYRDQGNEGSADPFEDGGKQKGTRFDQGDDIRPFSPIETRDRVTKFIDNPDPGSKYYQGTLFEKDKSGNIQENPKIAKKLPRGKTIDPTIKFKESWGSGEIEESKLAEIARDILDEAKTKIIDPSNSQYSILYPNDKYEQAEMLERFNITEKEGIKNFVGIAAIPNVTKGGAGTLRKSTTLQPVFSWRDTQERGFLRVGTHLSHDHEHLRSQAHRLGIQMGKNAYETVPVKGGYGRRMPGKISMKQIEQAIRNQGYRFDRLDSNASKAKMTRSDGTVEYLTLLPDRSGYSIDVTPETKTWRKIGDVGLAQFINDPDDTAARRNIERHTGENVLHIYRRISDGGWMEEPADATRRQLDLLADAIITGKLKTAKGEIDIDPQAILSLKSESGRPLFAPGSNALKELELAVHEKTSTFKEVDIMDSESFSSKNRAGVELIENLTDYKNRMGAPMPKDLGEQLIGALSVKYGVDANELVEVALKGPRANIEASERALSSEELSDDDSMKDTNRRYDLSDPEGGKGSSSWSGYQRRDPNKTYQARLERVSAPVDTPPVTQIIPEGSPAWKNIIEEGDIRNVGVALDEGSAEAQRLRVAYQLDQQSSNIPQTSSINTANASQVNAPEKPVTPTDYKAMQRSDLLTRHLQVQKAQAQQDALEERTRMAQALGGADKDVGTPEHDKAMAELTQRLLRRRR